MDDHGGLIRKGGAETDREPAEIVAALAFQAAGVLDREEERRELR
jgi:hypothetical protein